MLSGLTFGAPWWLLGLFALPVLGLIFTWGEYRAERRLARLIRASRLRTQLTGAASAGRRRSRYVLLLLALAALLVALAGPRLGYETHETHRHGLDLIVVVDVSKSMLATDLPPTRLARARLAVQDFIGQLQGDRVGLVAFAGTAFLQAPLTVDYDAVLRAVNELDTELIPRGGTNLGEAIDLAVDAFGKAEAGNRAILLLSDGEPTVEGEQAAGLQAAKRAADAGVKIFTLGFGTPEGSLIPLGHNGGFVRDSDGKTVRTKLDEPNLTAIAKAGGGFYVRFNGDEAIRTVLQRGLSQLKGGDLHSGQTRRPIERYQWPLGLGLLLLTAGSFLGERRRSRVPASARTIQAVPGRGQAAVAGAGVALLMFAAASVPCPARAEEKPAAAPSNPLELYQKGKYDQAYDAFKALADKNPDQQNSLEFNAGASAYQGKQYDEALDAFSKAMTSNNADLQAKANYNFANTLFRRGEGKTQDRDAQIADWKNALQHYDATLSTLKQQGDKGNGRLHTDTAYNRDFVQKKLDELQKQPQDKNQQKDDKKDKQDKDDKNQQQPQNGKGDSQDKPSDKKDGQEKSDGNQPPKPDQSPGQDQKSSPQNGSSNQNQPPKEGDNGQKTEGQQKEGNQPPQPSPGQSGQENPQNAAGGKGREHGDFQAKPGENGSPSPSEGNKGKEKEEPGKMNASQARALLNSLKDADAKVNLLGDSQRHHSDDDPPAKDW